MAGPPRSLSVFVPAHNEAKNLEGALTDIIEAAEATTPDYELLVVDDGSTDGTGELADRLAAADPRIHVIHHAEKRGIANGYRTALARAGGQNFAFLPGDREVDAASIRSIFGAIGSADLVVPYHANPAARAPHRRLMTSICTVVLNTLFRHRLRYYQGPTVYPTALARAVQGRSQGFFFLTEMLLEALERGHSYIEVGLIHRERAFGRSKAVSLRNIWGALLVILGAWWRLRVRPGARNRRADRLEEFEENAPP